MNKIIKVFLFACLTTTACAGSVRLANDSAHKLRAIVRAADGSYLGELIVMPQKTMQWTDYWGGIGGYYQNSQTPYTVIWYCVDGGDFSVCNNVASGATITAFGCDGLKQCKPEEKQPYPPLYGGAPAKEYLPEVIEQRAQEQQVQSEPAPH